MVSALDATPWILLSCLNKIRITKSIQMTRITLPFILLAVMTVLLSACIAGDSDTTQATDALKVNKEYTAPQFSEPERIHLIAKALSESHQYYLDCARDNQPHKGRHQDQPSTTHVYPFGKRKYPRTQILAAIYCTSARHGYREVSYHLAISLCFVIFPSVQSDSFRSRRRR